MIPMLLVALLGGCTTIIRFPPPFEWGDTWDTGRGGVGGNFDAVLVQWASVTCDQDDGTWTWEAETDGWTRNVALDVVDTSTQAGWEEQHIMDVIASNPNGNWDRLQLGPIPGGTEELEWLPNINTVFNCQTDRAKLTFVMRVWNHRNELTDCIVWGHDADELVSRMATDPEVADLGSCLIFDS